MLSRPLSIYVRGEATQDYLPPSSSEGYKDILQSSHVLWRASWLTDSTVNGNFFDLAKHAAIPQKTINLLEIFTVYNCQKWRTFLKILELYSCSYHNTDLNPIEGLFSYMKCIFKNM
jgi:hypothetical protein